MLGRGDHAANHRIVVQILKLLEHHLIGDDRLWMRALLPDLMRAQLVRETVVLELVAQPFSPFSVDLPQKLVRGEAFEIPEDAREIRRREDRVEVVIQYHPTMNLKSLVPAA